MKKFVGKHFRNLKIVACFFMTIILLVMSTALPTFSQSIPSLSTSQNLISSPIDSIVQVDIRHFQPDVGQICKDKMQDLYSSYSGCIDAEEKAKEYLLNNDKNFPTKVIQQCYLQESDLSKPVISYVQKSNCVLNLIQNNTP